MQINEAEASFEKLISNNSKVVDLLNILADNCTYDKTMLENIKKNTELNLEQLTLLTKHINWEDIPTLIQSFNNYLACA